MFCFLLQSLGFHRGIELIRQKFDFMCSAIHNFIRHHHPSSLVVFPIAASPATTSLAPSSPIPRHHIFIANMKLASQLILTCVFLHTYSTGSPPAGSRTAGISPDKSIPSPRVAVGTRTIALLDTSVPWGLSSSPTSRQLRNLQLCTADDRSR